MQNYMNKKAFALLITLLIILVPLAYLSGRNSAGGQVTPEKEAEKHTDEGTETSENTDLEFLYELNRAELEKLVLIDGPVYVIGHKSPDSDTVCSAIAYAALMNKLGIDAKPVVAGPINNESKYILERAGVEVPEVLYDASGTNIIMVDHSEYAQAVDGLADANIVSIIDHHGVGTVNVGHQLLYNAKPIGATATSIWMAYLNYGVEIDQPIAQILLGAILSDTDNLTASTTISADIKAVETLSKTAGIDDLEEYYRTIHERHLSYDGFTDEEILFSDYKEYESSGVRYGIGCVNAIDEEVAADLAKRMAAVLKEAEGGSGVDLIYASVRADNKKIDYIVPGNQYSEDVLKAAFPDYDEYDGYAYIFRSGLGRKSKFVPGLNDYLASKPSE